MAMRDANSLGREKSVDRTVPEPYHGGIPRDAHNVLLDSTAEEVDATL